MANLSAIRKVVNTLRERGIILAIVGDGQLTVHTEKGATISADAKRFLIENRNDIILALLQEQRELLAPLGDHDIRYKPFNRDAVTDANLAELGMKPAQARFLRWLSERRGEIGSR